MEKDITEILDAIVWAHKITSIDGQQFVFRPLSLQERNIASHIYEEALRRGKAEGRKTREELKMEILKKGIWKLHYDNDLKLLKTELEEAIKEKEKLDKLARGKRNRPSALVVLEKRMSFIESTLTEINGIHVSCIDLPSVEYHAEQQRAQYCVGQVTLNFPSMARKWSSHEALLDEQNTQLVHQLISAYYNLEVADEKSIREAAKSNMWRIKWSGSKKNGGVKTLFGRDMYDLTIDQFRLMYWSQVYDSAFESMEPPSDEIVENDELFDQWLDEQAEKRKQRQAKSEMDKKISKIKDGQEVGMMVDGFYSEKCSCGIKEMKNSHLHQHAPSCSYGVYIYYKPDNKKKEAEVEKIQSANPEQIRRLLAKEQRLLADKQGDVQEQELRRDDKTRAVLGMSTKIVGNNSPKGRAR